MTKTTFNKDIRRTITKNLSRFLAIAVMAGLGIGVFSGFATGCLDSLKAADRFYDAQDTYDIQIVSTLGLTQGDVSAAAGVDGVGAVYGSRSMDVKVLQSDGTLKLATLTALDDGGMNQPYVLEGTLPHQSGQLAVNSKFLKDTGLHVEIRSRCRRQSHQRNQTRKIIHRLTERTRPVMIWKLQSIAIPQRRLWQSLNIRSRP